MNIVTLYCRMLWGNYKFNNPLCKFIENPIYMSGNAAGYWQNFVMYIGWVVNDWQKTSYSDWEIFIV